MVKEAVGVDNASIRGIPIARHPAAGVPPQTKRYCGDVAVAVATGGGWSGWTSCRAAAQAGLRGGFVSIEACHAEPSQTTRSHKDASVTGSPVAKIDNVLSGTWLSSTFPSNVANVQVVRTGTTTSNACAFRELPVPVERIQTRWQFCVKKVQPRLDTLMHGSLEAASVSICQLNVAFSGCFAVA